MSRAISPARSGSNQSTSVVPPEVLKIIKLWDLYSAAQNDEQRHKSLEVFLRFCVAIMRPDTKLPRFDKDCIIVADIVSIVCKSFAAELPCLKNTGPHLEPSVCAAVYSWALRPDIRLAFWVLETFSRRVDVPSFLIADFVSMLGSIVLCLMCLPSDSVAQQLPALDQSEQWTAVPPLPPVELLFPTWERLPNGFNFLLDPSVPMPSTVLSNPSATPVKGSVSAQVHFTGPISPSQRSQDQDPMSALLACHILSLIGNLARDPCTLPTLIESPMLLDLVGIFSHAPRAINYGSTTVQRHLCRTIGRLFGTAFSQFEATPALHSCKIVSSLVEVLRSSSSLPTTVCTEVYQLISCLLRSAPSPLASNFMSDFFHAEGYSVFVKAMQFIGKGTSKEQQKVLIAYFCQLAFVDRPSDPLESLMYTVNFFNSFLCALSEAREMKPFFLRALGEILVLHLHKSDELAELGIFKVLFSQFNGFSLNNRIYVLRLLKRVLSSSSICNFSLQDDEIRSYVSLLRTPSRASTVFLVCVHLTKLIEQKRVSRARLRELGLLDALFEFLCLPLGPDSRFGVHLAAEAPVSDVSEQWEERLSESEELKQCIDLVSRFERKAQLSVIAELSSSPPSGTPTTSANTSYLQSSLSTIRSIPASSKVIYSLHLVGLDLLRVYLQENSMGQDHFREKGGLQRMYELLGDKVLRKPLLDIVATIAISDVLAPPIIVRQYFKLLESPLPSEAYSFEECMAIRSEILSSMRHIFAKSEAMKIAFREAQGMEWVINTISSQAAEFPSDSVSTELSISFVLELLDILAGCWRGLLQNLEYFKSRPGLYSSFKSALSHTHLAQDSSMHVRLADALIGMSLPASWPPACHVHVTLTANRFRASGAGSALSVARERSQTCHHCRDLLSIENPDMLKLLIELILQKDDSLTEISPNDASTDTAFILTLKAVKFLVEASPWNAQALSSSGLVQYVLDQLRPVLLKDHSASSRARSRQPLLLGLVERISQYSMTPLEFRKYMELLRSPTCPSNVLSTLCSISQRPPTPTFYFMFPKRKVSSVRIPDVAAPVRPISSAQSSSISPSPLWPPKRGYTISLWFQVESYGDSNTDRSVVLLCSLDSVHGTAPGHPRSRLHFDAYLYKGVLTVRSALSDESSPVESASQHHGSGSGGLGTVTAHTFNDLFFEEKQWYHLIISHRPPTSTGANIKTSKVDALMSQKGELEVWLDGKRRAEAHTPNSPTSTSNAGATASPPPRLLFPHPTAAASVQFILGNTGNAMLDDKGVSNASWSVGNVLMLGTSLDHDYEPFLLYTLGPNYVGGLDGLRGSSFFVFDVVSPPYLHTVSDAVPLLQNPANFSLSHLHEHILFLFSPKDKFHARLPSPTAGSSSAAGASVKSEKLPLVRCDTQISGEMVSCCRIAVKDAVSIVGGVSTVLYLIASAHSEEYQLMSLTLLKRLLEWNAVNIQQMIQCGGYEIVARVMRRREWILSEHLLECIFSLAGISRSKKRQTFSEGLISNVEALHHILLDWKIWQRAPDHLRVLLFKSLAEIASTSEHAHFNIMQLRTVKIRTLLLMMLEEDDFPYHIAQHVVQLLSCLMHDPWNVADVKAVFRFIVATHGGPETKPNCPRGVERHRNSNFSGISSGSRPTLSRLRGSSSSSISLDGDPDSLHSSSSSVSLSSSWNDLGDAFEFQQSGEPTIDTIPVRDLIISMLIDSISKGGSAIRTQFFDLCSMEVIFALLNTQAESSRILFLRLLELFLRDATASARFRKCNGFSLLGEILRSYPVSEAMVSVLLAIMLGRNVANQTSIAALLSIPLSPALPDGGLVVHPELSATILLSITSCFSSSDLQHAALKALHDLFLQDASIKIALLRSGLISSLCNILVVEFEHRVADVFHRCSAETESSKSLDEIDRCVAQLGQDEQHSLEDDVMHFLRAAVLFGCTQIDNGAASLEEALTALQLLPLPTAYLNKIQKRLMHDVIDFFLENSKTPVSQPSESLRSLKVTLSGNFTKVAILCVNMWIAMHQTRASEPDALAGSILPRRHSVITRPSPTKTLSRSNSTLPLSPGSPSAQLSRTTRTSPVPTSSQSLFHEILQAFDDQEDDRASLSRNNEEDGNETLPLDPVALRQSSAEEETGQANSPRLVLNELSTDNSEYHSPVSQVLGVLSPSPTKLFSSPLIQSPPPIESNGLARSISDRLCIHSRVFIPDSTLLTILLDAILEYTQLRSSTSPFKRLRQALKRKTVGVSSISEFDTDLSWHLEKLIFHTLTDFKEPYDLNSPVMTTALTRGAAFSREDLFFSETEYLARFLFYTYPLLNCPDQTICDAAWDVWKKLLLETPTKLITKIVVFTPNSQLLSYGRGDELKFAFVAGVAEAVTKVEQADASLRRQWNSSFSATIRDTGSHIQQKLSSVKQLVSACSTKIIEVQQIIIKPLIEFMRLTAEKEKKIRSNWRKLIKRLTHERAIWPMHRTLMRWELDSTEGPMRVRLRMKPRRAHKHPILGSDTNPYMERFSRDPRTLYADFDPRRIEVLKALEAQLNDDDESTDAQSDSISHEWVIPSGEKLVALWICSQITPFHKRDGELLLAESNCFFVDTHRFENAEEERRKYTSVRKHRSWSYEDIREIHKRRYLLVDNALEIFLTNGKTFLFAFEKKKERDTVYETFLKLELPNFVDFNEEVFVGGKWTKTSITEKWQRGLISNFEYLMYLNTLAGRSFNDLTQYPVFPFILRDYSSPTLDLTRPETFRDLSRPMGAQDPKRLAKFIEKYEALVDMEEKPYFYGSHYSNVGTVLHFLVRLEPFSSYFIEFQGGRFDVPDRTFYSLAQTWDLSSSLSQSDVKELIPEFFFLPEFLKNGNKFSFGTKQDGIVVDDVILPPWANGSARTFVLKHLEALESDYVSEHLHLWIDLIFGFTQVGEGALKEYNLYHPYTYEGAVDIDKVTDQLERDAIITQINSYGQTPKQLFKKPHPCRSMKHVQTSLLNSDVLCNAFQRMQAYPVSRFPAGVAKLYFSSTGQPYALASCQEILWPDASHYLHWGHAEGSLITAVSMRSMSISFCLELFGRGQPLDTVSTVTVAKNGRLIIAGSQSSLVRVWRKAPKRIVRRKPSTSSSAVVNSAVVAESSSAMLFEATGHSEEARSSAFESRGGPRNYQATPSTTVMLNAASGEPLAVDITLAAVLDGHIAPVTSIAACTEQSMFVTGSLDKFAIVWDMNRLRYLRQLGPHNGPVSHIAIQSFWGEVVVVDDRDDGSGSTITIWSINGDKICERTCTSRIGAITVTNAVPGVYRNVVITGHENGSICLWSHVDLSPVHELASPPREAITALCVSDDNTHVLSGDKGGLVLCHASKLSLITGST